MDAQQDNAQDAVPAMPISSHLVWSPVSRSQSSSPELFSPYLPSTHVSKRLSSRLRVRYALTHIIQLSTTCIHGFQQLIDLFVAHLLAQVGQDIAELAHADEAREVLVEDLEATAVLLGLAGVAEAAGAVEHAGEGVEVDCCVALLVDARLISSFALKAIAYVSGAWGRHTITSYLALKVADLGLGRVLAAGAQQVAEGVKLHAPGAALVEEGEGLLEVGALCLVVAHRAVSPSVSLSLEDALWSLSRGVGGGGGGEGVGVAG